MSMMINITTKSHSEETLSISINEVCRCITEMDSEQFGLFFHTLMEEYDKAEKRWVAEWEAGGRKGMRPTAEMQRCYSADISAEHHRAGKFFREMGFFLRREGAEMEVTWKC